MFVTKVIEFFGTKFSAIIRPKSDNVTTWLFLYFKLSKFIKQFRFQFKKIHPHFLIVVIDKRWKYLTPMMDVVLIGPKTSAWTSWRTLSALQACLSSKGALCCFLAWQALQTPCICCWMSGSPSTKFSRANWKRKVKFKCPYCWCQSVLMSNALFVANACFLAYPMSTSLNSPWSSTPKEIAFLVSFSTMYHLWLLKKTYRWGHYLVIY